MTATNFLPKVQSIGNNKERLLIFFVFLMSGIVLISLFALIVWMLNKNKVTDDTQVNLLLSGTPSPMVTDITISTTPIVESNKFDYLQKTENTIMQYDLKKNTTEELAKISQLKSILSISQDNKYLFVQFEDINKKNGYGFWNSESKELIKITIDNLIQYYWTANDVLNILFQNKNNYEVLSYNITQKKSDILLTIPSTIGLQPLISENLKFLITKETDSYLLVDLDGKTKYYIDSLNLDSGTFFNPLGWNKENHFIYYTDTGIYSFNTDNLKSTLIVALKTKSEILVIKNFSYDLEKKSLLFSLDNIIYYFDLNNSVLKEVVNNNDKPDTSILNFMGNGVYNVLMENYNGALTNYNYKTKSTTTICYNSCSSPLWLY